MTLGHELIGNGKHRVMVLHGWFGDHSIWSPTYPFLDTDAHTYAFVDYRGYGASRTLPGPYTMAQISADATALADQLGWDSFSVIGHSMGGMAAQRLAIDAPERVRAVVAVTPVPASGAKMPAEALALFESAATSDAAAAMVVEMSLGQRCTPALTRHILRGMRATVDAPVFSAYLKAFTGTDFASEAGGLRCPLLVLYGEHDGGVSAAMVNAVFPALYPAVQLRALPNAGHYPMVEIPPYLVTVVERFLMASDAPAA